VLDWMLARGLAATIAAYGGDIGEGRTACRLGPLAIARWTTGLRKLQAAHPGHADLLNALQRAAISADGRVLLSAAGVDAGRPVDNQADAFWWNRQNDRALADKLAHGAAAGWQGIRRLVRGTGAAGGETDDDGLVLTVSRDRAALVVLDGKGALIERIEA
jgi:hypothetical protein